MSYHHLKTDPESFAAVESGVKTYDYRHDDRAVPYEVGDVLVLQEWSPYPLGDPGAGDYTGREVLRRVTHVLRHRYVPNGYVVMAIVSFHAAESGAAPTQDLAEVDSRHDLGEEAVVSNPDGARVAVGYDDEIGTSYLSSGEDLPDVFLSVDDLVRLGTRLLAQAASESGSSRRYQVYPDGTVRARPL